MTRRVSLGTPHLGNRLHSGQPTFLSLYPNSDWPHIQVRKGYLPSQRMIRSYNRWRYEETSICYA
jgi:hypothetical protein